MSGKLGKKLWKKIEAAQGHAFIADSVELHSDASVYREVQIRIEYAKQVVKILEEFLEKDCKEIAEIDQRVNGPNHWEKAPDIITD